MMHVFLDTQVFVREGLRFDTRSLTGLRDLIAEGTLRVVITDIVRAETERHIREAVREHWQTLTKARRRLAELSPNNVDRIGECGVDELIKEALGEFERFLADSKAEILQASQRPAGPIFQDYFLAKAPFEIGDKKKNEFPDAFNIAALAEWKGTHAEDLVAVSADNGVARAAEGALAIVVFKDLSSLLDKYNSAKGPAKRVLTRVAESVADIKTRAAALFARLEFVYPIYSRSVKIIRIHLIGIDMKETPRDFAILQLEESVATVTTRATFTYEADMWAGATSSSEAFYLTAHSSVDLDVECQVTFDADKGLFEVMTVQLLQHDPIRIKPDFRLGEEVPSS